MENQKIQAVRKLMIHEGFKEGVYKCPAGKLTIGFGFNLEAEKMPIEVALYWLEIKVDKIDKILSEKMSFYNDLDDTRKSVLINMAFNLGIEGLFCFQNTLDFISKGKYIEASVEMLDSEWSKQVGYRSVELSQIMETGECYQYAT